MKSITLTTLASILLIAHAFAQSAEAKIDTVYASTNKTTTMVFPNDITFCDLGNEDFGFEKTGKFLMLKCATEEAAPTTILVLYGNGLTFHATLAHRDTPPNLFIKLKESEIPAVPNKTRVQKDSTVEINKQMLIKRLNILISDTKVAFKGKGQNNTEEKLALVLQDIRMDEEHYYLKVLFANNSKFNFDIDMVEFAYLDPLENDKKQKQRKDEYAQVTNGIEGINGKDSRVLAYCIKKFTMTRKGELQITFREKNGTRTIAYSIPYDMLVEAKTITIK